MIVTFMFKNHRNENGKEAYVAMRHMCSIFALFPFLPSRSLDITGKDFSGQWVSSLSHLTYCTFTCIFICHLSSSTGGRDLCSGSSLQGAVHNNMVDA